MKVFTRLSPIFLFLYLVSASPATAQSWSQVPSPNPGPDRNYLSGISAVSANEVWAVGRYQVNNWGTTPSLSNNLILKWDSTGWTGYSVANHGLTFNALYDVAAISSSNIWAVGTFDAGGGNSQAQLLHYNGTAWTNNIVSFPHPDSPWPGSVVLEAIDAISATDIWAVGTQTVPGLDSALAYHYNGTSWSVVPTPVVGARHNNLRDVDGIAPNDVWAVGSYRVSNMGGQFKPMAIHWDGTSWTNIPLPASLDSVIAEIDAVKMVASNDVWATGTVLTGGGFLIHWDGTSWTDHPFPGGGGDFAVLAPDNIYLVGANIVHYDGSTWTVVDSLSGFASADLIAAATLPNGEAWAVGVSRDLGMNPDFYTLVYRLSTASPLLMVTASSPQVPAGTPVQLQATTATPGNYTYLWTSDTPNAFSNPTVANPTVTPAGPSAYAVTVTDQAGRSMQGVVRVGIGAVTATTIQFEELQVLASPNPFRNSLALTISSKTTEPARLSLTDALGRVVETRTVKLEPGLNELRLPDLVTSGAEGYYLLTVQTENGLKQLKLLKQ